ncbi:hypothetical protein RB195_001373 [Necator americanus]|uniref:Uncharacterized protein n=1 Tax=Necator americanus TaxID=51031 RepID=A0ABR1DE18_NECAM
MFGWRVGARVVLHDVRFRGYAFAGEVLVNRNFHEATKWNGSEQNLCVFFLKEITDDTKILKTQHNSIE